MSDFIFSNKKIDKGILNKNIKQIYHKDSPSVNEYHGNWGSLSVSDNLYNGFQPYETAKHICIVIGGPVLTFRSNNFLTSKNLDEKNTGSKAIYERWLSGGMVWERDLSGPFAMLIVDKIIGQITFVTDMMSFIPIYLFKDSSSLMVSTHVDALAKSSNQQNNIDEISKVDFILHGSITFPFTDYELIKQVKPASVYYTGVEEDEVKSLTYWTPKEKVQYESIEQAASELRGALDRYIKFVTKDMTHIAQFISGGEDSRLLSSLLPKKIKRDSFAFLEEMNIEGKIAYKTAEAYGASFNLAKRSKTHYLDVLPACSDLVGSGSQFLNVHTMGFHKSCKLNQYVAVFGGLFSDALLKGTRIKKVLGQGVFPFLPQIKSKSDSSVSKVKNTFFKPEVIHELDKRKKQHFEYVAQYRPESVAEWVELWPISMNSNSPNLHGNRRLFRTYEPFLANEVIKISASVPQNWKLNRKLFYKTARPLFKSTKWLINSDGRWSYFPWYVNSIPQFLMWVYQQAGRKSGLVKTNHGSWADWNVVMKSKKWQATTKRYIKGLNEIESVFKQNEFPNVFESKTLTKKQKLNLLQVLYYFY